MAKTVVGLFDSAEEARLVVADLVAAGCRRDDISLVGKDARPAAAGKTEEGGETSGAEGLATGAGIGAAVGGLGGVLAGLGALAIPGIGPIAAAGPIAAGLAGAAAGAGAGGLIGGLIGLGIAEEEAQAYAEGVRRGKTLVIVKISDVAVGPATNVMNRHNPIDVHTEAARWRAEGGGVRIVTEQPATAELRLHQERVEVGRMPADRPIGDADRAFQERSAEMRETDEKAVVRKEGEEQVDETVRRTDVERRPER